MNKRIEQFAGQLGPVATVGDWGRVEWADNVYPQRGDKMYAAVDLEKFAESLIRKCAGIADLADENKCEWIGGNILTHFGVEE